MTITKRYFLDRNGIPTGRMQGPTGQRHYEIAQSVIGPVPRDSDFYTTMFKLKYERVAEDSATKTLYVDSLMASFDKLTNGQRRFINNMRADGWTLVFNSKEFLESRDNHSG